MMHRELFSAGTVEVAKARISYGGVAAKCIMATHTQAALEGQPWTQQTLDAALLAVAKDVNIAPDAPGNQADCCMLLNSAACRYPAGCCQGREHCS